MKPLLLYVILIILSLSVFGYAMGAIDFSGSSNTVSAFWANIDNLPRSAIIVQITAIIVNNKSFGRKLCCRK